MIKFTGPRLQPGVRYSDQAGRYCAVPGQGWLTLQSWHIQVDGDYFSVGWHIPVEQGLLRMLDRIVGATTVQTES